MSKDLKVLWIALMFSSYLGGNHRRVPPNRSLEGGSLFEEGVLNRGFSDVIGSCENQTCKLSFKSRNLHVIEKYSCLDRVSWIKWFKKVE